MITDSNGMPVLQPLVDDAATSTFNAAFALIGTEVNRRRYFTGTATARGAWASSGKAKTGDVWQDTNGDAFAYVYDGDSWEGVFGEVDGGYGSSGLNTGFGIFLKRYANNTVEGYYNAEYSDPLADGATIGLLPTGFRPAGTTYHDGMMSIGGAADACGFTIGANGEIKVYGIGGTGNKRVSLNFKFKR